MAVKTTVSMKRPTAKKKAASTKAKASGSALQATSAQWKTYQKAYSAAYQNRRLNAAARALRARKQQSANKAIQAYATARHQAQAASVAAFAAQQTANQAGNANQNAALRARVNANLRTHLSVLSKAQYSEASSRNYMQQAVQQTQTLAAAKTYEEKAFAVSTRISKISYKPAASAIAAAVKANAQAQSASASLRSVGAKTSTSAARGRTSIHATSVHQSGKANRSPRSGQRSQAAVAKSAARSHASSAKSVKATSKAYAARTAPKLRPIDLWAPGILAMPAEPATFCPSSNWLGDPWEPECTVTAVANQLLGQHGIELDAEELKHLSRCAKMYAQDIPRSYAGHSILHVVLAAKNEFFSSRVRLKNAWPVPWTDSFGPGCVIGYKTENGPHAAVLLMDGKVATWGGEEPMPARIDEAWVLQWEVLDGQAD